MKIKIIKPDGSKAEIEIEGAIDFQGMGVLSPDEVTALKTRAEKSGEDKAAKTWQDKIDAAEKKLADYEASLTDKQRSTAKADERIASMEKTLQELRTQMERATKEAAEANVSKALADARAGIAFVEGGQDIFDLQMRSKLQADGTYILATGERGTLDQARIEWATSPIGKAMIRAEGVKPGTGTGPASLQGVTFGEIVKNSELKEKFIAAHGASAYTKQYLEHQASLRK
jgi:hypothetical protein